MYIYIYITCKLLKRPWVQSSRLTPTSHTREQQHLFYGAMLPVLSHGVDVNDRVSLCAVKYMVYMSYLHAGGAKLELQTT